MAGCRQQNQISAGQLMPDITAVQTVEDFLAGRDTAVELVRTLE